MKNLQLLVEKIDYTFSDIKLLQSALTHRSVRGANNERLEFLGDAALNFIIAEALYQKHPEAREGELSRLRASLVKGETLAVLARQFKIANYLRLGAGELKSGGAHRASIQADAIEAIIGAILLDSDFETCQEVILSWYQSRLDASDLVKELKDPKTQLQEYLQSKKYPLPQYSILKIKGEAHAQVFQVKCKVKGLAYSSEGQGQSRRKAEQEAATNFLMRVKK